MSGGYIEGVRHTRAIHMAYRLETIGGDRARELRAKCSGMNMHSRKADINGVCVQLNTANKAYVEMWSDNFYHMSDSVRSHAMIYCLDDPSTDLHVEYHVESRTAFLFNFDYYGWVKSIALGLAGNILEDSHSIYSVHGAALDIDGAGVTLIAPSKTGKTTQSWGLLRMENSHLITDDWYFVKFGTGRPRADGSEKNCYIDADIGDVWEEYKALVQETRFDNKGRGIANVRWVTGEGSVIRGTKMRYVFLLKRDYSEAPGVSPMEPEDALEYLKAHDYCNPHQLLRDEARMAVREGFFRRYLSACEVYMVNTTLTAEQTQAEIRKVLSEKCGARRSLPRVRDLVRDLHRVLADVAAEHEDLHAVLLGTAEALAERGVRLVVGHEAPHAGHLHDEHRVGLVPLADAGLEAPDVLEAPLRGRVREAAHPVPLEGDALHLGEYPPAPGLDVEVEPRVPVHALREHPRVLPEQAAGEYVLVERLVRGLRVYVDQEVPFVRSYQVVPVLPPGGPRLAEDGPRPGDEDLPAPAGVLDVGLPGLPVDEHVGHEPVGPADELRPDGPPVAHGSA